MALQNKKPKKKTTPSRDPARGKRTRASTPPPYPKERSVDVFAEDQVVWPDVECHLPKKQPYRDPSIVMTAQLEGAHSPDPGDLKAIQEGRARCVHMWPTAADLDQLKGRPKPWLRETIMNILHIDFYFGRVPIWFIEQKLLKHPGEFLLSRAHDNTLRLSVMSKDKGNPVLTFNIAFEQTNQTKGDRNFYYRIVDTQVQCNTVYGLVLIYRECPSLLEKQTKRKAELLYPMIPCQMCVYTKTEYNFHSIHIRHFADLVFGDPIREGRDAKVLKGTRTIVNQCDPDAKETVHNVIIKAFEEYNAEVLNKIFLEMHIVQTLRRKIGWDTVVNVEGVYVFKKPYSIVYTECDGGSLLDYAAKKKLTYAEKIAALVELADTVYLMHRYRFLHSDIKAGNVFVDTNGPNYMFGGMHFAIHVPEGRLERRVNREHPPSPRYTAPEVMFTELLTEKTDVYAFGMMIYEVLKGEKPIKAMSGNDLWNRLRRDPTIRPAILDFPPPLKSLMKSCWLMDPEKRPGMDVVCKELYKLKNDENEPKK